MDRNFRNPSLIALPCTALVMLAACGQHSSSVSGQDFGTTPQATSAPSPAASVTSSVPAAGLTNEEASRFDALTILSTIVEDDGMRARFAAHPPQTEDGRRTYVFELRQQPGMTPGRHYQVLTVTWARAGAFDAAVGTARLRSTGGPNGSVVDASMRTADLAYDVNVSVATLLPSVVSEPDIDLARSASALIQRYEAAPFKQ